MIPPEPDKPEELRRVRLNFSVADLQPEQLAFGFLTDGGKARDIIYEDGVYYVLCGDEQTLLPSGDRGSVTKNSVSFETVSQFSQYGFILSEVMGYYIPPSNKTTLSYSEIDTSGEEVSISLSKLPQGYFSDKLALLHSTYTFHRILSDKYSQVKLTWLDNSEEQSGQKFHLYDLSDSTSRCDIRVYGTDDLVYVGKFSFEQKLNRVQSASFAPNTEGRVYTELVFVNNLDFSILVYSDLKFSGYPDRFQNFLSYFFQNTVYGIRKKLDYSNKNRKHNLKVDTDVPLSYTGLMTENLSYYLGEQEYSFAKQLKPKQGFEFGCCFSNDNTVKGLYIPAPSDDFGSVELPYSEDKTSVTVPVVPLSYITFPEWLVTEVTALSLPSYAYCIAVPDNFEVAYKGVINYVGLPRFNKRYLKTTTRVYLFNAAKAVSEFADTLYLYVGSAPSNYQFYVYKKYRVEFILDSYGDTFEVVPEAIPLDGEPVPEVEADESNI